MKFADENFTLKHTGPGESCMLVKLKANFLIPEGYRHSVMLIAFVMASYMCRAVIHLTNACQPDDGIAC